jgi:hypothetical protein
MSFTPPGLSFIAFPFLRAAPGAIFLPAFQAENYMPGVLRALILPGDARDAERLSRNPLFPGFLVSYHQLET